LGAVAFREFSSQVSANREDMDKAFPIYHEMTASHIEKIENLDLDGVAVTDGKTFCECAPNVFMVEIENAILEASRVMDDDSKN